MQRELLDRERWSSREQLGSAIFEWIEGFYNLRHGPAMDDHLSGYQIQVRTWSHH